MNLIELTQKMFGKTPSMELNEEVYLEAIRKKDKQLQDLDAEYRNYVQAIDKDEKIGWRKKSMLSYLYTQTEGKKENIFKTVGKYKENYLYTGILQLLVEDALSHDPATSEIVQMVSPNSQFKRELDDLQERIDIDTLVSNIVEDVLTYGEYFLRVEIEDDVGVTRVVDDIEQQRFIAVYEGNLPVYFLKRATRHGTPTGVDRIDPSKAIHFCYGYSKLRMKLDDIQVPEYVRIGKPLMWGTFNLLNYLDVLTALVPALYVQKLSSTSIIGVSIPDGTSPEDALKACQRYESILNRFSEMRDESQITMQVLNAVGRFKCIPVWGDRGQMSKMDPRWDDMGDVASMEDLRRSIMASVGVPYSFLFGGGGDKQETLKTFARYLRKLGMIQKMVKDGLTQLALIHLARRGLQPRITDIDIRFSNTIIDTESLDKLEYTDALVSVVKSTVDNVTAIAQGLQAQVNSETLQEFLGRYLRIINLENLFILPQQIDSAPPMNPDQNMEAFKQRLATMQTMLENLTRHRT